MCALTYNIFYHIHYIYVTFIVIYFIFLFCNIRLLTQVENYIKLPTLLALQQNINTFFTHIETVTFELETLDIYYCVKLKEDELKMGLRQLQELSTFYCALTIVH